MFALAEMLHITVADVMKMSLLEYKGWMAYLNRKSQRMKADANKRATNIISKMRYRESCI